MEENKYQRLVEALNKLNKRLVKLEETSQPEYHVEQSDDIAELVTAMVKAQAEMKTAGRSASGYNFKYADLQECIEASRPALTKHGLAVLQPPYSYKGDYIYTILAHSSGQYIKSLSKVKPEKEGNQGYGAALTYAKRYAYCSMIGLSVTDENDIDRYNEE